MPEHASHPDQPIEDGTMSSQSPVSAPAHPDADPSDVEFQRLKTAVHEELIASLDLSLLGEMDDQWLVSEVSRLAVEISRERGKELSPQGLASPGPRPLGRDLRAGTAGKPDARPVGQRHPRQRPCRSLCGAPGTAGADERRLCRRSAPDADHSTGGHPGGPPRRRSEFHGRCPAARRVARQCDHPAAGPGWTRSCRSAVSARGR